MTRSRILWLLLLTACADVTAPPPAEAPAPELAPVLRFVGVCARPALWRLSVDGMNLPPTGLWWLTATDSLDFAPVPGGRTLEWSELGDGGWTAQVGVADLDIAGTARVVAACLP
jgi:hypothetical protein